MNTKNASIFNFRLARYCLVLLAPWLMTSAAYAWNYLTPLTNLVVCPGATATFSTTATGPLPYRFEWWKNGVVIAGQTNNSLTLHSVTTADTATYSVKLTGGYNAVTNSATLTVRTNVSATPLTNEMRYVGTIAAFSTRASGTGPFAYSWRKNGTTITGATTSSLVLTNLAVSDSGNYSVVVSAACSSVTNSATLMVDTCFPAVDAMLVIDRSGSMSGFPYNNARLACSNFVSNLHYGGTNGDQAGLASYNSSATLDQKLTNSLTTLKKAIGVLPAAQGNTSISLGLQTGQTELLSARRNPQALPVLLLLSDGQPTGSDTPSNALYQATLAKNAGTLVFVVGLGTNVDNNLLTGIASSPEDYYFTTNASQLGELFNAISSIICRPPTNIVTLGPSNLTVCAGSPASFSVSASGCDQFKYQWLKDGARLSGQTNNTLVIASAALSDAGVYSVEISSVCKSVTNSATLTVNQNVVVAGGPSNVTACVGTAAGFTVNASGTGLTYQWYKGTGLLAGQTTSSLAFGSVALADAGTYSVVVRGVCGNAVTNSATLTVNQNLVVVNPPGNVTACAGSPAGFSVSATGTGLTYQWFKGAGLLASQTGSSLAFATVTMADAGIYTVIVSAACGNSVTNSATLAVNQNTVIATPLLNLTNCAGTPALFSVNATGVGLSYQWFKGAALLAGRTGSSLLLTNISAVDAGVYTVVVTGTCGNSVTNSASLTVNQNIVIATPLVGLTNCPGTTASFSLTATGTGLTYQWYKNNSLLTNQTGSSLLLTNVAVADGAIYSVVVSGSCGNSVTNSALLAVNPPVQLVTPLVDQTNCAGATITFTVSASGVGVSYHWYRNEQPIDMPKDAELTSSSLTLSHVATSDAGIYSVVIVGICGDSITNSARLVVNSPVLVTVPPANQTNCPGTPALFSVTATGTSLSYQWYKGAALLPGQTGTSLVLTNVGASDVAVYSVVISGICGSPVTNSASLTVNANLVVASPLHNLTNCPATPAAFSVSASGTGLSYLWFKGATLLTGQTGSSLILTNVSANDAGVYSVVISGACGNSVTNTAVLAVNQNLVVATPLQNLTNCPNTPAMFSVTATGTGLAYQWFKGTTLLTGQTGSSLLLTNVSANNAGVYSVVISGTCGNSVTNSATLVVNQTTVVATPLQNLTNCPGTLALFSVNATGTGLTYQWFKAATLLAGRTGSSLLLTNVSALDAGVYRVVISGACGNSVTNTAVLAVNQNPVVATPLMNLTNCPNTPALFSVSASGTGLTYQWFKGPTLIAGQTGTSLLLTNVGLDDVGIYSVVISGTCGNSVTNSATLVVNQNTVMATPLQNLTNCPGTPAVFNVSATGVALAYQWFKGPTVLVGRTGSSLVLSNVSAGDAGVYSVVISGGCGNPVTNSASLTVNQSILVATPLMNQTNCAGTPAIFSVSATGTGLAYQWFKGSTPLVGQTVSMLLLSSVSAGDAGIYSVVISGLCGNAVTNSAALTVNPVTAATPLAPALRNVGESVTFSTVASGTGPFTYVWAKNGTAISGATSSSLTLTNLTFNDDAFYSVTVNGTCQSATQTAKLTINHPPVVSIISPTNGAIFVSPGTFTVLADAQDSDGVVTNVDFYLYATNLIGHATNAPYFTEVTNLPAGIYTFIARATDELGARGTSAPVSVTVIDRPSVTNLLLYAEQANSLYLQKVRVTNPTYSVFNAIRIYITGLSSNVTVYSPHGITNGITYVQENVPVAPGTYQDFYIEYYTVNGAIPTPSLRAELVAPEQVGGVAVSGTLQPIHRFQMFPNNSFLIEFASVANRVYYVQYTSDLVHWKTTEPALTGNGGWYQWIDNGAPKTESAPSDTLSRFYRIILLP